jgi:hypothetical protein
MLDEIARSSFFMYCHKDPVHQRVECAGSVLFKRRDQRGNVFLNEVTLVRAHARSRRPPAFRWCRDGEDIA